VFQTKGAVRATPVVAGDTVYVGLYDHHLYALDARTGEALWNTALGGAVFAAPTVVGGVVLYVGTADGRVTALTTAGGAKLWAFGTGAAVRATPVVEDGAVYVSSADGAIYGLDARTGAKLWTAQTKNRIISAPVVADGVVYAGSADNGVYALEARTGKPAWTFYALAPVHTSPHVVAGVVYAASGLGTGSVDALDARSGQLLWSFHTQGEAVVQVAAVRTVAEVKVRTPAAPARPGCCGARYFKQTAHNLSGAFLDFWQSNGGAAVLGYPRTEAFVEKGRSVQYTDRFRLELTSAGVVIAPLGSAVTKGRDVPPLAPLVGTRDAVYFTRTKHSLQGRFLTYWRTQRGAFLLGLPISEPAQETLPDGSGRVYEVQWFEQGRLQAPVGGGPMEIGAIGKEDLQRRGWIQ